MKCEWEKKKYHWKQRLLAGKCCQVQFARNETSEIDRTHSLSDEPIFTNDKKTGDCSSHEESAWISRTFERNSSLFEFDQNPTTIFWMQKDHWLSMSTDSRLLWQGSNLLLPNIFDRFLDVIHLDANMMDPTGFVFIQEILNWTFIAVWMEQLNKDSDVLHAGGFLSYLYFGIAQIDEDSINTMFFQRNSCADGFRLKNVLVECNCFV